MIVSTRIRKRTNSNENIVIATSYLFPGVDFYEFNPGSKEAKEAYYRQLDASRPFFAQLIKGSILRHYNIFFICSDKEWKGQGYLQYIRDYIIENFAYPVYNYKKYVNGCALFKYDKDYTLKICNKILKKVKKIQFESSRRSDEGKERLMRGFKKESKKDLMKRVKKLGLYYPGMGKAEMLDTIESFL